MLPRVRIRARWVPLYASKGALCAMRLQIAMPAIGISVIDHTPKELLFIALQHMAADVRVWHTGKTVLDFGIRRFLINNQLPDTSHPYVLGPVTGPAASGPPTSNGEAAPAKQQCKEEGKGKGVSKDKAKSQQPPAPASASTGGSAAANTVTTRMADLPPLTEGSAAGAAGGADAASYTASTGGGDAERSRAKQPGGSSAGAAVAPAAGGAGTSGGARTSALQDTVAVHVALVSHPSVLYLSDVSLRLLRLAVNIDDQLFLELLRFISNLHTGAAGGAGSGDTVDVLRLLAEQDDVEAYRRGLARPAARHPCQ